MDIQLPMGCRIEAKSPQGEAEEKVIERLGY